MHVTLSMNFTNHPVLSEDLPSVEEVEFQPLEDNFVVVERISLSIYMAIFLFISLMILYFIDDLQSPLILVSFLTFYVLFAIFRFIAITINFKYSGYALRERDILYRNGWLKRKTRVVMLNRIQHVSVQSGPLERRFGLSSVSVFTAGSSEADFTINGITDDTALRIKAWINSDSAADGDS